MEDTEVDGSELAWRHDAMVSVARGAEGKGGGKGEEIVFEGRIIETCAKAAEEGEKGQPGFHRAE